jgi:hypothetical protein
MEGSRAAEGSRDPQRTKREVFARSANRSEVVVLKQSALHALADAAHALARIARAAAEEACEDPASLVPLPEAARVAGTSKRVVRDAIRAGELPAFGRQRDRSVRRSDLQRWIESRRVRVTEGPDDLDIERRVARIARARAARGGASE